MIIFDFTVSLSKVNGRRLVIKYLVQWEAILVGNQKYQKNETSFSSSGSPLFCVSFDSYLELKHLLHGICKFSILDFVGKVMRVHSELE